MVEIPDDVAETQAAVLRLMACAPALRGPEDVTTLLDLADLLDPKPRTLRDEAQDALVAAHDRGTSMTDAVLAVVKARLIAEFCDPKGGKFYMHPSHIDALFADGAS